MSREEVFVTPVDVHRLHNDSGLLVTISQVEESSINWRYHIPWQEMTYHATEVNASFLWDLRA